MDVSFCAAGVKHSLANAGSLAAEKPNVSTDF